MQVKALRRFDDKLEKVKRLKGAEFEVTEERFRQINGTQYGILVEAVPEKELSIKEIKLALDEKGIEYAKTAKKADLEALLEAE